MPIPFAAIGAAAGAAASLYRGAQSDALQEKFAKKAIRWKVADAKAAGIHPLYALGANTVSYSPSSVGDVGPALSDMGNSIERSVAATSTSGGRVIDALALERAGLENDLLRAQIASVKVRTMAPHVGPAMPGMIPEVIKDPARLTGVNIGAAIKSNPMFSDAQSYEDRYGELGGSMLGILNIPADLGYAFSKTYGTRNYSRANPAVRR